MKRKRIVLLTIAWGAMFFGASISCASNDWVEGSSERADGATRDYYNRAARLKWKNYMGDWADRNNKAQGAAAYGVFTLEDNDTAGFISFDVTNLVKEWIKGRVQNQGMLLRGIEGKGSFRFRSREYGDPAKRPRLLITTGKKVITLPPAADTYLEPSTYRSLGDAETLKITMGSSTTLLRFDVRAVKEGTQITGATLRLFTFAQYGGKKMTAGIFRCTPGQVVVDSPPLSGLASHYKNDKGIESDPAVLFSADFESDDWAARWSSARGKLKIIPAEARGFFKPFQGRALCSTIAKGANHAMSLVYKFKKEMGREPEEIFFRYYLRLGNSWNQTIEGGKLPGISGTYGIAGWGGRKSDGTNGWSARGAFHQSIPEGNPLAGTHPIGTYCYHADQPGIYGEVWLWQESYRGYLQKNRWYSIEQYVKLNTPGRKDGIIQAWVDGRPAFEKTDIRFRTEPHLKIEQIWMNVYHGGKAQSPHDQDLFIDNVVIAKKYIGPMETPSGKIDKQ